MRDQKPRRLHPPLKLRKQHLRVLGGDQLDQVVGGIGIPEPAKAHPNGREFSRNCLG